MDAYKYEDNLESVRLRTRFLNESDFVPWADFFKDEEAIALFPAGFLVPGANHAKNWVERQLQRYKDNRYGMQALIDKTTGELVGQCGLLKQEVDGIKETEVGYHVIKKYWGKGYAPEAARLFINYAFRQRQAKSIISIIARNNQNSIRVAEKNGLYLDKSTIWNGMEVHIFRVDEGDFMM